MLSSKSISTFSQSQRMVNVQTPIIPVIGDLIRRTLGTISLAQGVVSYPPPSAVDDALKTFGNDPRDHLYGSSAGQPELLDLIKEKLRAENGVTSDLSERVIVTAGANMAFLNAMFAILDPGDEVILPKPYYFNHEMAIEMVNGVSVPVETDDQFQLDLNKLNELITDRTRAIVTVSPNNPTGVMYPREVLTEINKLCRDRGIYHICDEAYEYFTYDKINHFSPISLPDSEDHTIALYSLSKAYGFASWRVGYMVIPQALYMPVMKAQDTNLICNSLIAQSAAQAALRIGQAYCQPHVASLARTRELILAELQKHQDLVSFPVPQGAFYIMLKVNTDLADMQIAEKLIEGYQVGVLPGSAFGLNKGCYLRVSYGALSENSALFGIERLIKGLRSICYNH